MMTFAFYLFAVTAVVSGVGVVISRHPVHSVLWLILAFLCAAGLFVLLGAEFVAMLLVIVYVGAVAVLFLFVVMMLDIDFAALKGELARYMPLGLLIGVVLLILGFAITGLADENTTVIVIGTVIRSLGAGPLLSAVFALVPDVVEYGNWKFGIRSEGLISSAQSIGSKVGIGLGSALTGWILAGVGYVGGPDSVVTDAVIRAVRFDYTWLGAIIGVVILVIVLMLNVEKYASEYSVEREKPFVK